LAKIIIFTESSDFLLSHRRKLVDNLCSRFQDVTIICKETPGERKNIKGTNLKLNLTIIDCIRELQSEIVNVKGEVVIHSIGMKFVFLCALINLFYRNPFYVYSISGLGSLYIDKRLWLIKECTMRLFKFVKKIGGVFIFQNKSDIKTVFSTDRIGFDRGIVLIPGSGTSNFRCQVFGDKRHDANKVLLPARLTWQKGILEFCKVARSVSFVIPNVEFIIRGEIPSANSQALTVEDVERLEREYPVKFLPFEKNPSILFKDISLIVFLSYREGFPKAVIDAAAYSIPCVTWDVPGSRDAVVNGKTGYVEDYSDLQSVVSRVCEILSNPRLRNKLSIQAYRHAITNFDEQAVVDQHFKVYSSLLKISHGVK
jgi:glycosyltransferase involved in cell wall biosynthesis